MDEEFDDGAAETLREAPAGTVVYTAQLEYSNGRYTLTVRDRVRGRVHVSPVSGKLVDKLPVYLDMLKPRRG